jgi:signal transduction histidine kinase/ActR/RegA family two-component response regulator
MPRHGPADTDDKARALTRDDHSDIVSPGGAVTPPYTAFRDTSRILRLLTLLSEPASQDRLFDSVLWTLSELFSSDIVVLLDPAGTGHHSPLCAVGLPEELMDRPFSDAGDGYVADAMARLVPVVSVQASVDPRVDTHLRALGAETGVWLPVTGSQGARGVLILARCRPAPFARADVDLLSTMAYRIGLTLEQSQRSFQLTEIERYAREVGRHLEEAAVAAEAVKAFPVVMGADAAALVVRDPEGRLICAGRSSGLDAAWDPVWCRLAERSAGSATFSGMPALIPDLRVILDESPTEEAARCPARSVLAAPVFRDDRAQGLLLALRFTTARFCDSSTQMAALFAGQTAAALANSKLYRAARNELAERMRAEQERERMHAMLHEAQKMRAIGTFTSGIAHDFNNLLLAIIGNLEIAQGDVLPATKAYRAAEKALFASMQAADLIRTFMTFADGGDPISETTETAGLIVDAISHAITGPEVRVEYLLPDDLWPIEVDRGQVTHALGAVALNAQDAMPGGGLVRVSAENLETESSPEALRAGRYVRIAVADRGIGIPEEDLPRIFDPYFSTKARGATKGMGLGLAIALSIIVRHRGSIRAESRPGGGTVFFISLPAAAAGPAAVASPVIDNPARPPRTGARLLLLEDEQSVAATTLAMLGHLGYADVEHVKDGAEAIERYSRARTLGTSFLLVMLDLTIQGGMGGTETLERLRQIDPGVRAIASSGYSSDPVMSRCADFGFAVALPKPYRIADLRQAIEIALAGKTPDT